MEIIPRVDGYLAPLVEETDLPPAELPPAGVIEGRVVDPEGRPVEDARIQARVELRDNEDPGSSEAREEETRTSAEGRFRLRRLTGGMQYRLTVDKAGFAPASRLVEAASARSAAPTEVVLRKSRVLAGRIVDEEGRPVAGADVWVRGPGLRTSVRSGRDGEFAFLDLLAGMYGLAAWRQDFAPVVVVQLEIPEEEARVDLGTLTLRKAVLLEGRIVDSQGSPVEGVQVVSTALAGTLPDGKGQENPASGITDSEGLFRLRGLQPGERVTLYVQHSEYLPLTLTLRATGERLPEIVLRRGAEISGRVVDGQGEPVHGAVVRLLREAGPGQPGGESASTDASGRFHLKSVEPGRGRLIANTVEDDFAESGEVVFAAGEELKDVVITLRRGVGVTVEGRVLDARGQPAAGAEVSVVNLPPLPQLRHATTDEKGQFRLKGVLPGIATVSAVRPGDLAQARRQVSIQPGRNEVELVLESSGHPVSGRVVDEAGEPLPGMPVWLDGAASTRKATSAADGSFMLANLPDGSYKVHSWSESERRGSPWVPVVVAGGPIEGIELRVQRFGRITGRMIGMKPEETLWVKVNALNRERQQSQEGWIDHAGRFEIVNLLSGSWDVQLWDTRNARTIRKAVVLAPGAQEAVVDLEFQGELALTGRVLQGTEPLADVTVHLEGSGTAAGALIRTDSFGGFRIEGLEPGSYRLDVKSSRGEVLHSGTVELPRDAEVTIRID